jgi:hypothetical protein
VPRPRDGHLLPEVVLDRLSRGGWKPEPVAKDTWHARCPVDGGSGLALVVRRGENGLASLRCRNLRSQGKSCPEEAIWRALGLEPPQREVAGTAGGDGSAIRPTLQCEPARQEPAATAAEDESAIHPTLEGEPARQEPAGTAAEDGSAIRPTFKCEPPRREPAATISAQETTARSLPHSNGISQEPIGPASAPPLGRPIAAGDDGSPGPRNTESDDGKAARRKNRKASRRRLKKDVLGRLREEVHLLRGLDHRVYAHVPAAGHREVHDLESESFRN